MTEEKQKPAELRKERARLAKTKPNFLQWNWFRYKRIAKVWRRPRGRQSKLRLETAGRPSKPSSGYGTAAAVKYLHPSGYEDVLVHNQAELEKINPENQAVRFSAALGKRKKTALIDLAQKKGVKLLNA